MRLSTNAKFDQRIEALAEKLGIPKAEVVNLILSRYLSAFETFMATPVGTIAEDGLLIQQATQPTLSPTLEPAKPLLIDTDLPPLEL